MIILTSAGTYYWLQSSATIVTFFYSWMFWKFTQYYTGLESQGHALGEEPENGNKGNKGNKGNRVIKKNSSKSPKPENGNKGNTKKNNIF